MPIDTAQNTTKSTASPSDRKLETTDDKFSRLVPLRMITPEQRERAKASQADTNSRQGVLDKLKNTSADSPLKLVENIYPSIIEASGCNRPTPTNVNDPCTEVVVNICKKQDGSNNPTYVPGYSALGDNYSVDPEPRGAAICPPFTTLAGSVHSHPKEKPGESDSGCFSNRDGDAEKYEKYRNGIQGSPNENVAQMDAIPGYAGFMIPLKREGIIHEHKPGTPIAQINESTCEDTLNRQTIVHKLQTSNNK